MITNQEFEQMTPQDVIDWFLQSADLGLMQCGRELAKTWSWSVTVTTVTKNSTNELKTANKAHIGQSVTCDRQCAVTRHSAACRKRKSRAKAV